LRGVSATGRPASDDRPGLDGDLRGPDGDRTDAERAFGG
jgi:hypothetical protein